MAIVSMTGFAEAHGSRDGARWRWEAKCVNGRGLDLRLRTPPGFDGIEPAARALAGERFKRGSLQAQLTFESGENARGLKIDPAALAAAVRIAREVASETGLAPARVDGLLALKGVIVQEEALPISLFRQVDQRRHQHRVVGSADRPAGARNLAVSSGASHRR